MSSIFRNEPGSRGEGQSRRIYDDVYVYESNREPCIICGHETGDCTGESGPPKKIAWLGYTEELIDSQTFLIEEDIYEERQITPFNKIKVLVHRKGKSITLREAEKLGLWKQEKN